MLFVERGLPTNLVPNRDVGAQIHGDLFDGAFTYAFGAFNGVVDGGSGDLDNNDSKEFAGRLFGFPFKASSIEAVAGTWSWYSRNLWRPERQYRLAFLADAENARATGFL